MYFYKKNSPRNGTENQNVESFCAKRKCLGVILGRCVRFWSFPAPPVSEGEGGEREMGAFNFIDLAAYSLAQLSG